VYSEQIQKGDDYENLKKTIGIHLLNFDVLDEKEYHNTFHIMNARSKKKFSDILEIHYIELSKVPKDYGYIQTALDRWSALLARAEKYTLDTLPEPLASDDGIRKAMEVFETTRLGDNDRELYEGRLKWLRDESAILKAKTAKAREEGKIEGLKKGKIEGREEGKIEGREEGKIEGREESKIETARVLKA
ncbi:MAG: Rpn family recombination-promoting nuclease/putative transposase, partial [Herbaspirillum sp.]|uniref:Rpn family recombination-promoting nuclease/putative transposase n=1 Tax=Herbaspirillum sp. TaxID=1890675 RepID=UPI002582F5D1